MRALLNGFFAAALALWCGAAQAEQRIALLIANADYPAAVGALGDQPARDVAEIAAALEASGFKRSNIVIKRDLNRRGMLREVRAFADRLRSGGADVVGFFYYAGHGASAQSRSEGGDYLLPARVSITSAEDLIDDGYSVRRLVSQLRDALAGAPEGALFVVLDSCRNTLTPSFNRGAGSRGFGAAPNSSGLLISYAAPTFQQTPNDGAFARVLAAEIRRPNQYASRAFNLAGREIARLRGFRQNALPVTADALTRDVCFNGCPGANQLAAAESPARAALRRAKELNTKDAFEAVIAFYPKSAEASEARRLLAALRPKPNAAPRFEAKLRAAGTRGAQECANCPVMVAIPGGRFTMGSPRSEPGHTKDEGPQRTVRLRRFALAKHEVTVGAYRRFVEATDRPAGPGCAAVENGRFKRRATRSWAAPGYPQGEDHPVVCVSRKDALDYVRWLNQQVDGAPYRLPSEAEWEYAARAGASDAYAWGGVMRDSCTFANVLDDAASRRFGSEPGRCDDGHAFTAPVGQLRANRFGVHDMIGNVWEVVADCWAASYAGAPTDGSAQRCDGGERAVLRGASWVNYGFSLRISNRSWVRGEERNDTVGFRIARTLTAR